MNNIINAKDFEKDENEVREESLGLNLGDVDAAPHPALRRRLQRFEKY